VGLRDAFRRRAFKGAIVGALDRKYRINLRAEVQHLSAPTLDDMLNELYENTPGGRGGAVATALPLVEEMLGALTRLVWTMAPRCDARWVVAAPMIADDHDLVAPPSGTIRGGHRINATLRPPFRRSRLDLLQPGPRQPLAPVLGELCLSLIERGNLAGRRHDQRRVHAIDRPEQPKRLNSETRILSLTALLVPVHCPPLPSTLIVIPRPCFNALDAASTAASNAASFVA
jgi:hypothetical protein